LGLSPVGEREPIILILGSFPSQKSLSRQEYYGNPKNQFWLIIEMILGIPIVLPYKKRLDILSSRGILLWDVLFSCTREGSSDSTIQEPIPNDIRGLLELHPSIRCIVLNGVTGAGKYFQAFFPDIISAGIVTVCVLPSTSPAYAGMPVLEKAEKWKAIIRFLY